MIRYILAGGEAGIPTWVRQAHAEHHVGFRRYADRLYARFVNGNDEVAVELPLAVEMQLVPVAAAERFMAQLPADEVARRYQDELAQRRNHMDRMQREDEALHRKLAADDWDHLSNVFKPRDTPMPISTKIVIGVVVATVGLVAALRLTR